MSFVEHARIPFTSEPLLGERLLVLAPHPDDEVIGCGGLIANHTREGRAVRVVVVTDGGASENSGMSREELVATRQTETDAGLAELGAPPAEFLGFPDRGLAEDAAKLIPRLRERLLEFRPDLLVLTGPTEIHPDHAALGRIVIEMIQQDPELAGPLALCRIAFVEISAPIRPNILVDISEVALQKQKAIAKHQSQMTLRDYGRFASGLNQYRTMTLGVSSQYAEAYHVTTAQTLRTVPLTRVETDLRGGPSIEVEAEPLPITVVVRTRNRPNLLRQAIGSIRLSSADASVVVVNDGEMGLEEALEGFAGIRIEQGGKKGRSEAMNSGVRAASTDWIAFLDDDDLFYPEHLPTLGRAAKEGDARAWYTDAVSVIYEPGDGGAFIPRDRLRNYSRDFDREALLLDNYIPLPTLLLRRDDFLDVGGFDPAFDLFEDWDFLIRLSAKGPLVRIPRLTCEVRHFVGSGSAMLDNPAGSAGYETAKLRVWEKHGVLSDPRRVQRVFESSKARLAALFSRLHEEIGRGKHLEGDISRLEREKGSLISQLQAHATERSLEKASLEGAIDRLERERKELQDHVELLDTERSRLEAREAALDESLRESVQTTTDLFGEIGRLNALLTEIYSTRAWRLHQTVERLRGRK